MTQPHYMDREAVALLPCPFCGGDETSHGYSYPRAHGYVECHTCGGAVLKEYECEAIAAWNRRPPVNIALPKPALAQTDGYTTADELKAVIRQWLDADDPTAWGPFERALDGLISGGPTKCAVCGCLSLDGKAYFPARKGAKP